jgi:putative hydrolase of the HAD superfamily
MASEIGELYISRSPRKTTLVEGSIEILEYLQSKYELHIITNGFEEVQHIKMASSGLEPYFGHVITSESAGAKKPSPIIYRHAEDLTKAKPEESIMIGDHYEADVFGAMQAGWKAVLYERNSERKTDEDYVHIQHLQELKEFL